MEVEDAPLACAAIPDPAAYPSFIDPNSPDRNFDHDRPDATLLRHYATSSNCMSARSNRDMARIPIQFSP